MLVNYRSLIPQVSVLNSGTGFVYPSCIWRNVSPQSIRQQILVFVSNPRITGAHWPESKIVWTRGQSLGSTPEYLACHSVIHGYWIYNHPEVYYLRWELLLTSLWRHMSIIVLIWQRNSLSLYRQVYVVLWLYCRGRSCGGDCGSTGPRTVR